MSILQITPQFHALDTHTPQTLTLDGVRVRIVAYTNIVDDAWYLDTYDGNDNPLVLGLALVTGLDLWFPYRYMPLPPGMLFVQDQTGLPMRDPVISDFVHKNMALFYQGAA